MATRVRQLNGSSALVAVLELGWRTRISERVPGWYAGAPDTLIVRKLGSRCDRDRKAAPWVPQDRGDTEAGGWSQAQGRPLNITRPSEDEARASLGHA